MTLDEVMTVLILIVLVLVLLELTEQLHAKFCCSFCNHRYGFICVAGQVVSSYLAYQSGLERDS